MLNCSFSRILISSRCIKKWNYVLGWVSLKIERLDCFIYVTLTPGYSRLGPCVVLVMMGLVWVVAITVYNNVWDEVGWRTSTTVHKYPPIRVVHFARKRQQGPMGGQETRIVWLKVKWKLESCASVSHHRRSVFIMM